MPRQPRRLGTALALVFVVAGAGTAQAGFAPGNDPIVAAEQMAATGFDTDAQGNSLVAWSQKQTLASPYEVKARRLSAGGTAGPVFDLAPGEIGYRPELAMTPSGRAFVAWRVLKGFDPSPLVGRWVEPDGSLGPLLTIVAAEAGAVGAVDPHVAVDPAGVATVSWVNEFGNTLGLRRVQPDGTLGAIVPDISGGGGVTNPEIAALPNGSTVAIWRSAGIEKNVVTAALAFGAPETISLVGTAADPEIAVDSIGNGLVTWRQSSGEINSARGRLLDPTGAALGAELLIDPPQAGFVGSQVRPAADSAGDFLVTWNRQDAEGDAIVYARGVNSAGAFAGPPQPLSEDGINGSANHSALFDAGLGAALWNASDSSTVFHTLGRGVDRLGAPISGIGEIFGAGLGVDAVASEPAAGVAAFLIEHGISGSANEAVIRRYLLPPSCADSSATVVQGRPIAVPAVCSGPAVEAVQVLEQPTHGALGAFDPLTGSFAYAPAPGYAGPDSFAYAASNDGGVSGTARVGIAVGKDTVRPRIKSLKLLRKKGRGGKPKFRFKLLLSEPARGPVRIERLVRDDRGKQRFRKVGRVLAKKLKLRHTLPVKGKAQAKLRAGGRFRATAVVVDSAFNESKPRRLRFRVAD